MRARVRLIPVRLALALGLVGLPLPAVASDFDGSRTLLCALIEINECDQGVACEAVTAESIDAPDFIKIDFAAKTVGDPRGERPTSAIQRLDQIGDKLILQGADSGIEGVRGSLGWTLTIALESGKMIATGAGDAVAYVIFGACNPL